MRIFIEPSDPELTNIGDISMLQVAVTRLKKLWPDADIQVLTDSPNKLPVICPGVEAINARGQRLWFSTPILLGRFIHYLPLPLQNKLINLEKIFRKRYPSLIEPILQCRKLVFKQEQHLFQEGGFKDLKEFLAAVSSADLLFVTGMGGINDSFPRFTDQLLNVLQLGHLRGASIVMMGQGFGPLKNPQLRAQAEKTLILAQIVALREERSSLPLLKSLGVKQEKILVTGDDAIELVYPQYDTALGNGVGINLRAAPSIYSNYSGISYCLMESIRDIIQHLAQLYHAPLIPVPISRSPANDDAKTIQYLLSGYVDSDGGAQINAAAELLEQIKQCRVVITGSYHAGVFALSLGIPVVALAKSDYYVDKFLGLSQQFGIGCNVVLLDKLGWAQDLKATFNQAWSTAEDVKSVLLESARKQIESGHTAYQNIYKLFH